MKYNGKTESKLLKCHSAETKQKIRVRTIILPYIISKFWDKWIIEILFNINISLVNIVHPHNNSKTCWKLFNSIQWIIEQVKLNS